MEHIVFPNITQNIIVVSTQASRKAGAKAALRLIHLGSTDYHTSAYTAASYDTCKCGIRGVDVDINERQLAAMIVNPRNPRAMKVHHIKETTTVVALLRGIKRGTNLEDVISLDWCGEESQPLKKTLSLQEAHPFQGALPLQGMLPL
ncbi:hypothetical protein HPB51_029667 [Rhipicephalus microplus]|uniref:Uncharacterized protein n=1 Tax=Rhipicephalus microplus TaxID=6941 RepID=A0A9J6CTG8_RHIMP|nr:hypothetical protein HPB51_029667 [Rhipicephalus microplus]